MIIKLNGSLIIDERVRGWCALPYPGHPKGCPNLNVKDECPSKCRMIYDNFNLKKDHWFAIIKFDMEAQMARMLDLHPDWSEKQCRCCLYWQEGVRKKLRQLCESKIDGNHRLSYTLIPEAGGVHVFDTMLQHGISMSRDAYPVLYKIALIGYKNRFYKRRTA